MTYAPATLTALGAYWTSHGGTNLGVVGDTAHQAKGTSYHLGRDQLQPGAASTVRDRAGLSNAASPIDLGRLNGSLWGLQGFSRWLVEQCRANASGTRDVREVIYSPDGTLVLRYDRERGANSAPRPGEADASHRTHTHISYYRDSESRDKRPLWRRYFEVDMAGIDPATDIPAAICDVAAGGELLAADKVTRIASPWAGATGVGLYARPVNPAGWAAIRIDRLSGEATKWELAWCANAKVGNVHAVGAKTASVTITGTDLAVQGP